MIVVIPSLYCHGVIFHSFVSIANYNLTGNPSPNKDQIQWIPDYEALHTAEINKLFQEKIRNGDRLSQWPDGTHEINGLCSNESLHNAVRSAIQAVFSSLMVMCWTTFESLAADLWRECLNSRPELGIVALEANPLDADSEEEREKKSRKKISLPAWIFGNRKYDFNTGMGNLLRECGKFDFSSRSLALDAYVKAFGRNHRKELSDLFNRPGLKHLAALRHVTVHNAGRADVDFLRATKGHAYLGSIVDGFPISLDGEICGEFLGIGIASCIALLQFVDRWFDNNKYSER